MSFASRTRVRSTRRGRASNISCAFTPGPSAPGSAPSRSRLAFRVVDRGPECCPQPILPITYRPAIDESDSSFWSSRMDRAASSRTRLFLPVLPLIALVLSAVSARADLAGDVDAVLHDKLLTKARVGVEVIKLG